MRVLKIGWPLPNFGIWATHYPPRHSYSQSMPPPKNLVIGPAGLAFQFSTGWLDDLSKSHNLPVLADSHG